MTDRAAVLADVLFADPSDSDLGRARKQVFDPRHFTRGGDEREHAYQMVSRPEA
jgi:hypothetical protein